jgi:putative mRNA 3-end processing factor
LSDHCDFNELIKLVKISGAERIYTVHGFVDEFADELTKQGFYASSLQESSLDNFT